MLPDDVRLFNLTIAPPGNPAQQLMGEPFHAIKSATAKLYIYRFTTNPFVEPMLRNYVAHVYLPTDLRTFEECLALFVGTHDFKAFGNRVEQSLKAFDEKLYVDYTTIRTINSIRLVEEGRGLYRVEFHIKSAIYKMIRNIVGTSLHVAAGHMSISALRRLLEDAPPRTSNVALPAPPQGLTLEHVYYNHF
jgi:tRNA pseudouridine38-40 synthase